MCAQLYSTQLRETMEDGWHRSDVFPLSRGMAPPDFMWAWEDKSHQLERRRRVIQEHFNKAVSVLGNGEGYEALLSMKERIASHLSTAKEEAQKWRSRREYMTARLQGMRQKVREIAEGRSEDSGDPVSERDALLNEPLAKYWQTSDGMVERAGPGGEWSIMSTMYSEQDEINPSDIFVDHRPDTEKYFFHEGFDEDHIRTHEKRSLDGDDTWSDALESIEKTRSDLEELHKKAKRTKQLLHFRLGVVDTVLCRFEMFCTVEEMTEEEAEEIAEKERSGNYRRMMDWEMNAAQLYAYVQEHGQPSSMDEWEAETKVSTRQAWDRLQENDYGIGTGVSGLHNALREWAPEFERKYGTQKAKRAASPFTWPDEHEA